MRLPRSSIYSLGFALLVFFTSKAPSFAQDSVTLKSGDVIAGSIISESESQVVIEVSNPSRTIFSKRYIPKSDIKSIQRESAETKQQRAAFEALGKYKLDPNQEFTSEQYGYGIAAFEKFVSTYPEANEAEEVRQRIEQWKSELSNVQTGKVKFLNRWMSPNEKTVAVKQWQKQKQVEDTRSAVATLTSQLKQLELEKRRVVESSAYAQGRVQAISATLPTLHDTKEPMYVTETQQGHLYYDSNGQPHKTPSTTTRRYVGERTVPNPEKEKLSKQLAYYQAEAAKGPAMLAQLDSEINLKRQKLNQAEEQYKSALAEVQK